jgi:hypothetical protein
VVRLGVSGHRRLEAPDGLVAPVDALLDDLGDDGMIVSSLAEGADRLVAWRALRRSGWTLVAVLPLAPDDYRDDFASDESREEFDRLIDAASEVEQVAPQPTRVDAYLAAGLRMLERSDALVAVWDGEPARGKGGTAEIVARARTDALPVAWLHVGEATATVTKERWPWGS